jgi:AAA+ ATPase superfamily predicted ATPase
MMIIVGREKEIAFLTEVFESDKPEFIAIFGRRRVGKTHLVREFFKDKGTYFELTGIKDAPKVSQLKNFAIVYADTFFRGDRIDSPRDWDDALNILRKKIEKKSDSQKRREASYNIWAGYAFENLCFLHYREILRALEISVVAEAKSGWHYLPVQWMLYLVMCS